MDLLRKKSYVGAKNLIMFYIALNLWEKCCFFAIQNLVDIQSNRFLWYSFVFERTQSRLVWLFVYITVSWAVLERICDYYLLFDFLLTARWVGRYWSVFAIIWLFVTSTVSGAVLERICDYYLLFDFLLTAQWVGRYWSVFAIIIFYLTFC